MEVLVVTSGLFLWPLVKCFEQSEKRIEKRLTNIPTVLDITQQVEPLELTEELNKTKWNHVCHFECFE